MAILSLVGILSVFILLALFRRSGRHLRPPPGPFALPVLGHFHLLAPIPHQALHKLSVRYGPLMSIRLGSVRCVVASNADTAKEFLKTHDLYYANHQHSKAAAYLSYGLKDFFFAPYGSYWRFMKKLCVSELLGGRTLEHLLPVRREEIAGTIRTLFNKAEEGAPVDMGTKLATTTNNIICRMLMSRRFTENEDEAGEVQSMVVEMLEVMGKLNLADYVGFCRNMDLQGFDRRLERVRSKFDTMMERILKEKEEERKEGKERSVKDLLDLLMDIAKDHTAEVKLTRENIKAFVLDILAAGTDTAAITMEWALAELINNPTILQKAREEIDTIVGKNRLVDESDIPNLPYLQAIVKETLRLHPTAPLIMRVSNEDCTINGYNIPARTTVFVNVWAIGKDPNYWSEPLEFLPERFTEGDECGTDFRGQHFHFLPFGSGRRTCPGMSLAIQVIQPMLGAMIQCFDFKASGDGIVDMAEAPGFTLPRAQPLVCDITARLNLSSIA